MEDLQDHVSQNGRPLSTNKHGGPLQVPRPSPIACTMIHLAVSLHTERAFLIHTTLAVSGEPPRIWKVIYQRNSVRQLIRKLTEFEEATVVTAIVYPQRIAECIHRGAKQFSNTVPQPARDNELHISLFRRCTSRA